MTMTLPKRPRGRPRPAETIARDEKILHLLRINPEGLTRNAVAEAVDLNKSRTYLALDRLRRDGLATKSGTTAAAKDTLWTIAKPGTETG